ncbi:hypothetical protein INN71_10870 [Nocardioides sp. ChNu-153]|uniref:hypothetical protein n=1 Tax=unclassified Nocardioides TaxID=2615069 RepID=UPI002405AF62|nr:MULTISPECIES: hypothetical protein [unclassified Nocardioides]MDF9715787.1 hypothetical protein [Nocardioides sp. ChNu-99]MDN7121892.1 hypothetical protein [Nocardioides sp. ChNu-153]
MSTSSPPGDPGAPAVPGVPGLPPDAPHVALRVAVTTGTTTVRSDLVLLGSRGALRTPVAPTAAAGAPAGAPGPRTTTFPTAALWPTVRNLLPDLAHVVADPAISRPEDRTEPPADLATTALHVVTTSVGAHVPTAPAVPGPPGATPPPDSLAVRTWLVTATGLYGVGEGPLGTTIVTGERAGALAATLQWDVAGALDHLVRLLEQRPGAA